MRRAPATGLTVLDQRIQGDVSARIATSAAGDRHVLLAIATGRSIVLWHDTLLSLTACTGIVSVRTSGTAGRIGTAVAPPYPASTSTPTLFEVEFNTDVNPVLGRLRRPDARRAGWTIRAGPGRRTRR